MSWSLKKELGRKAIHAIWFFVMFGYFWLKQSYGSKAIFFPLGILVVFFILEIMRLEFGFKIPFFWKLIRPAESETLLASTYAMIGVTLSIAAFDEKIAIAAVSMMVFGDLAAGLVGAKFGRHRFSNGKSLEGTAAELFTNLAVGLIILESSMIIIPMAVAATVIETACRKLNDNMAIPIFSGFAGQLVIWFL